MKPALQIQGKLVISQGGKTRRHWGQRDPIVAPHSPQSACQSWSSFYCLCYTEEETEALRG